MDKKEYQHRIEAINFSMAHDDGASHRELAQADVILVGVSRSGKTPTSLYLALQFGVKAANYPLIPGGFPARQAARGAARRRKREALRPDHRARAAARDPQGAPAGSSYAELDNCRFEVEEAEGMMRREGIR